MIGRLLPRSLHARLVGLVALALGLGLALTGITALTLLNRSLTGQVDTQLAQVAQPLAQSAYESLSGLPNARVSTDGLPSDYYVLFIDPTGTAVAPWSSRPAGSHDSTPRIPGLTLSKVLASGSAPFTVSSTQGSERWRVVVRPLAGEKGSVAVALPLRGADATMAQMRSVLIGVTAVVVVLGAWLGSIAVHRSMRPLREIEDTAAAIAAGDLTQRVPEAPVDTEVGRLASALNGMLGQIESAFAAREASQERMRQFVSDASHELRTPLATVRGYAELHRMGATTTPEQLTDSMRRIEESATRMGSLVEDLLVLARMDEGRQLLHEDVDLAELAADAAHDLRALDPTREVHLSGLPDGAQLEPRLVRGDPMRLRQVVTNLVGNVAAHTPTGSPAHVAVGAEKAADGTPGVVLEVRDHGPGIDPLEAARIFERFYRVDTSRGRGRGGGAGLGMAIVASIVAAHHGNVAIAQTDGGGTTVRVWLPTDDRTSRRAPENGAERSPAA